MASRLKEPVDYVVIRFYEAVRGLLTCAGRYARSYKLRVNLSDPASYSKVQHVFERYYSGDSNRLDDENFFRRRDVFKRISEINMLLAARSLRTVSNKDVLVELLLDEKRRAGWKKLIRGYQRNNEIVPLQEIELEYRRLKAT